MFEQINEALQAEEDPEVFNQHKFEDQHQKYMQVLDTDYKNYMVVYTCQENSEFTEERSGRELLPEEVYKAFIAQKEYAKGQKKAQFDDSLGLYDEDHYDKLNGIKRGWIYKQKI
mmetsp:Transcript_17043/g.26328  ORF Transcript_17043/g.26328 Transcript_17043/m.26328 type:complete len:115 (+) Transcript_17043:389-733(+)